MTAYYNELDPYAAQWLRNLIAAGHIADGVVDERSITDVQPSDLSGFTQCHFFAGIGVWSHALRSAGWADDRPVWTGSCPCQPFSDAGEGNGTDDERHLWPAWFDLIRQCHPAVVFGEQVEAAIKFGWFDIVQTDLERVGYAVAGVSLCAAGVGAPHIRQRLYWMGDTNNSGLERHAGDGYQTGRASSDRSTTPSGSAVDGFWSSADWLEFEEGKKRPVQPGIRPMAARTPNHMGRCRAYGNAIVAPLAAEFIAAYMSVRP